MNKKNNKDTQGIIVSISLAVIAIVGFIVVVCLLGQNNDTIENNDTVISNENVADNENPEETNEDSGFDDDSHLIEKGHYKYNDISLIHYDEDSLGPQEEYHMANYIANIVNELIKVPDEFSWSDAHMESRTRNFYVIEQRNINYRIYFELEQSTHINDNNSYEGVYFAKIWSDDVEPCYYAFNLVSEQVIDEDNKIFKVEYEPCKYEEIVNMLNTITDKEPEIADDYKYCEYLVDYFHSLGIYYWEGYKEEINPDMMMEIQKYK